LGFLDQAITSIIVGAVISVLAFVPIVWFQFIRYGRMSGSRLAWLIAGMVYLTALVTYTLFPLPDTSGNFCGRHPRSFILNPLTYFRDMWHDYGQDWAAMLDSWAMLQMALNVALFVPLGIILHQLWNTNVLVGTLVGFGASLLIELTQYTGNWWLEPCSYRVADINDLMTNTFGALLGAVVASLLPRIAGDATELVEKRGVARPVTRARRWMGQFFDIIYYLVVELMATIGVTLVVLVHRVFNDSQHTTWEEGADQAGSALASAVSRDWVQAIITALCLLLVLVPAFVGSGASLGQRTVHLKPVAPGGSRTRLVLRAVLVQGALVTLSGLSNIVERLSDVVSPVVVLLVFVSMLWVVFTPRGFSFLLTGCRIEDSRQVDQLV
jgi:glycopeptide antibiotics resistance protein